MLALACRAQDAWARWQYYDGHNRLTGSPIGQIVEDRAGRIWLADWIPFGGGHLMRNEFDDWLTVLNMRGFLLTIYPAQNIVSAPDSSVWFPDDFGTAAHISDSGPFPRRTLMVPGDIIAIAPIDRDSAFVSSGFGLYRVGPLPNSQTGDPPLFSPAPPAEVRAMKFDRGGTLWAAVSDCASAPPPCTGGVEGVARLEGDHWRLYTSADGLAPEQVVGLMQAADGAMWAVHVGNHVSRFDGTVWQAIEVPFKSPYPETMAWAADSRDGIWLAAYGAISHLGFDGWRTYGAEEEVPQNYITAMCVDSCGQVWVGLFDGRVGRFSDEQRGDPRAPGDLVRPFEDASGGVWSSTMGDSLRRFDGLRWPARGEGLPAGTGTVFQTREGVLWAGSASGMRRFDGNTWVDCCPDTASPQVGVVAMAEAPDGTLWFDGGDLWRYDGARWTHFRSGVDFDTTAADPLSLIPRKNARTEGGFAYQDHRLLADSAGRVWIATYSGCSMFEHGVWRDFRLADSLGVGGVVAMRESPQGDVWAALAGYGGLSLFRNGVWKPYPAGPVGSPGYVEQMVFDRSGDLWATAYVNFDEPHLVRYGPDGWRDWNSYDLPDLQSYCYLGLTPQGTVRLVSWPVSYSSNTRSMRYSIWNGEDFVSETSQPEAGPVRVLLAQRDGRLWLETPDGVRTFDPDQTPPQTVLLSSPAPLIAERTPNLTALATRTEPIGIEYSFTLDGSLSRDWSSTSSWRTPSLPDGEHLVEVRARDALENVDPVPAGARFVVDGTAPIVSLTAPTFNSVVQGTVAIRGSILEAHPKRYLLAIRRASADSAAWDTLASGVTPSSDLLTSLATTDSTDGSYELLFEAEDQLGLRTTVLSRIRIDNVAPSASQVSPVDIEQYSAGDVFSEDLLARAYFPPGSFNTRAHVELDALGTDSLASAGIPHFTALRGYSLRWGAITLMPGKVGILDLSIEGLLGGPPWVMETRTVDGNIVRLGGSADGARVSVPLTASGTFYVGVEDTAQGSPGAALALSLSPRVFRLGASAALSGSSGQLAIAFGLAQPERVTLAVFNRAGRRLRLLTDHEAMQEGDHVVRWDGRDEDGRLANDGLYMISAEFGGDRRVLPFAVVR